MIATPIPREMLLHVVKTLPAAPRIMSQLGHLLLDPNSDMGEITELLRRDTALTARIIRISNSAFYNPGQPYGSLDDALARVGYMEVYRLVGLAAVSQMADQALPLYGVEGATLRENSLLTALVMEVLASMAGIDTRLAYTAGLLRSVGKIALDRITRNGSYNGRYQGRDHGKLGDWETQFIGMTNCEAAAVILKEWRFPLTTIAGIRDHYLTAPGASPLAQLLNLSAGAAERGGHSFPGETDYWTGALAACRDLPLEEAQVEEALRQALELFGPLRAAVN
jgi:HD-like signal output (HDOD) protein